MIFYKFPVITMINMIQIKRSVWSTTK